MAYTLWSRGRLLGKTDFGFRQTHPKCRGGEFAPTELGERLLPIFASLGPALRALYDVTDAELLANPNAREEDDWPPPSVRNTTAYADAISLSDELDSLGLELRDEDGAIVETENIAIGDTEQLMAITGEDHDLSLDDEDLTEEIREAIEQEVAMMTEAFAELEDEPWLPAKEFARYQIFVALKGHDGALSGDRDNPPCG